MSQMPRVKVFGVGGAGCNLIEKFMRDPVPKVEYFVVDNDSKRLRISSCENRVLLMGGDRRGADRVYAQEATTADRDILGTVVKDADMVLLVGGMGGSVGSVFTPVLAEMAKKEGAFTVATVCTPFRFEEQARIENTERGMQALREYADTVIPIPCEKQNKITPDNTLSVTERIKRTDETLMRAVNLLTEPVLLPKVINLDYEDIAFVMRGAKDAFFGFGVGEGEDMAKKAFDRAICGASTSINDATDAVLYVEGGEDMMLNDVDDVVTRIKNEVGVSGNILFGVDINNGLAGKMKISMLFIAHED